MGAQVLRVETSFQDTPDGRYFFVLSYNGRPLAEQLTELALKDGDTVRLWEEDCGDYEIDAMLMVGFRHPAAPDIGLWARADSASD